MQSVLLDPTHADDAMQCSFARYLQVFLSADAEKRFSRNNALALQVV